MSRIKRNESIQKFKNDPNISVMLISLKAGGLGLTLTIASRVYLFEPHFNPAAEVSIEKKYNYLVNNYIFLNIIIYLYILLKLNRIKLLIEFIDWVKRNLYLYIIILSRYILLI